MQDQSEEVKFCCCRALQEAGSRHQEATAQSSKAAELEAARLRAELDQSQTTLRAELDRAQATLRTKEAELQALQHNLAAAESAAARAAAAPAAAAPGATQSLWACRACFWSVHTTCSC